jgi:hypothetical protein
MSSRMRLTSFVDIVGENFDVANRAHSEPLPDSTLEQRTLTPAPGLSHYQMLAISTLRFTLRSCSKIIVFQLYCLRWRLAADACRPVVMRFMA